MRGRRTERWTAAWMVAAVAVLGACGKPAEGPPEAGKPGKAPRRAAAKLPAVFAALPQDTLLAVAVTDLDGWRAGLKQTALNDIWEDPSLQTWRVQSWPKFKALLSEKTGVTAEEIDGLIHGDMLFVLKMIRPADSREPQPRVAAVIRPSTNKAQLDSFVQKIFKDAEEESPVSRWAGEFLIVAQDVALAAELEANLKAGRTPLDDSKAFGVLQTHYNPGAFTHVWVDGERAIGLIRDNAPESRRERVSAMLGQVGVANLSALYFSSSIHKKGFLSTLRVQCDGERQGILALLGENSPSQAIRLVPHDTQLFTSCRHVGLDKILAAVQAIAMATGEITDEQWQQAIAVPQATLGINVASDLPRLIGKELALAVPSGAGIAFGFEANLYVESPDAAGLLGLIDKILARIAVQPAAAEHQGAAYKYFSIPGVPLPFQISYGSVGDFVVVSTQQAGLRKAIDALKSKRSLADNPDYSRAVAEIGEPGYGESYMKIGDQWVSVVSMATPVIVQGLNEVLDANLTAADIPNVQVFIDHQIPGVTRDRVYPDAIESRGYAGMSAGVAVPLVGVIAGASASRLVGARGQARVTSVRMDLRSLSVACEAYFVDWNAYPGYAIGAKSVNGTLGPDVPASSLPGFTPCITTPIAYITRYPPDPFAPGGRATYLFWSVIPGQADPSGKIVGKDSAVSGTGYIIISAGPDGDYDLAGEWDACNPGVLESRERVLTGKNKKGSAFTYDPTNGTKSDGDIWHAGGGW